MSKFGLSRPDFFQFALDFLDHNSPFDHLHKTYGNQRWSPKLDMIEQENQYLVELEVPGLTKDDIEIQMEQGNLIVTGTRKSQREIENTSDKYYRKESYTGTFTRSVPIPLNANDDAITANVNNGILTITLPKSPGSLRRQIEVE